MRYLVWLSILTWAAAACTSSSNTDPTGNDKTPIGFTFLTADGTMQSIGWSGQFHAIKGAPLTSFGVKVTNSCAGGVCNFTGPVAPDPAVDPTQHQRCLYQTSKTCTQDSDCPGPGGTSTAPAQCVYLYDPPISTPIPGVVPGSMPPKVVIGACALTYIPLKGAGGAPSITGTLNLKSGALNIDQLTVLLVINSIGDGTNKGVCPVCMGDTSPSDGKKEGTCMLSPVPGDTSVFLQDPVHAGDQKCDVNRYGDLPGYNYGYSTDCSPTFNGKLPPVPFSGNFNSSGFKISISDQSPKCGDTTFGAGGANCFCGMCSNASTACASDAECPSGGMCVASSAPGLGSGSGNIPAAGNLCDNGGVCNWDPNKGVGFCTSAKLGGMMVNCFPAASTGSKDGTGNPVSITAPGSSMVMDGVYYANTASARCTAAGPTPASNQQVGLPGLTFQKRNFRIIPSYTMGASQ
jgi:hypothetical protein